MHESPNTAATKTTSTSQPISRGMPGSAVMAPATKSSESPGRKGVTTSPVSQKMMTNSMAYVHW